MKMNLLNNSFKIWNKWNKI